MYTDKPKPVFVLLGFEFISLSTNKPQSKETFPLANYRRRLKFAELWAPAYFSVKLQNRYFEAKNNMLTGGTKFARSSTRHGRHP